MKIAIVGWGVEGQSAYRYFGPEHDYLIVNEGPLETPPAESKNVTFQVLKQDPGYGSRGKVADLSYLDGIDNCDLVFYTPIARKNLEKIYPAGSPFWAKAKTIQDIFFERVKTKNIIGITGTKGKGTTATLVAKILKASGKKVHLGGNIGRAVLDFVTDVQANDWVVLELANFQLYKFTYSPHVAVCLTVVAEHLDWHENMNDYLEAKANLFRHQKPEDIAIYYAKNEYSKKIAGYSAGKKVPYCEAPGAYVRDDGMIVIGKTEVIDKTDVKLIGEHNLQNICAALTAVFEATGSLDGAKEVLSNFSGLEHRLELVRELGGIRYYDDSFAATPDAGTAAIRAIPGNKVMIMGGFDRQLPLEEFASDIKSQTENIRKIVLVGQSAKRVAQQLGELGFNNFMISDDKEMSAILSQATEFAKPGDAVVLSPGFASFDMFKNFEVRGREFKKAVMSL